MATDNLLTGIFDIEKNHFDVSLTRTEIKWIPIEEKHRFINIFQSKSTFTKLNLHQVFGVKVKRRVKVGSHTGYPLGVAVFYRKRDERKKDVLLLRCSNEEICQQWRKAINDIVKDFPERPKKLNVIIHEDNSRAENVYRRKVQQLFEYANIIVQIVYSSRYNIDNKFQEMQLKDIDGIVCIGDDGYISDCINVILKQAQCDAGVDTKNINFSPARCLLPIGIISTGPLDIISSSSCGSSDPVQTALNIIFGDMQALDACSLYYDGQFQQFCFTALSGFYSDCIKKQKWPVLIKNKYTVAAKSLVNLGDNDYTIEFLPRWDLVARRDTSPCRTRCKHCSAVEDYQVLHGNTFSTIYKNKETLVEVPNHVKKIQVRSRTPDQPHASKSAWLNVNTSIPRVQSSPNFPCVDTVDPVLLPNPVATPPELPLQSPPSSHLQCSGIASAMPHESITGSGSDNTWHTVNGSYLSIGLFIVPGICNIVPNYGLSPYTHIADSNADLVVVQTTTKTNFLHHLRKYNTNKDPFDFPFINVYRVKAVRISSSSPVDWSIDGHVIQKNNIEIRAHHQLLAVFSSGISQTRHVTQDVST
ncbi:ceramide kinase-like protein [Saccoglossus kowalevskii]|uniref:Ceramide kinase-like n=1 Tax=Saccoglossus kowalevskii TaxID=10224 RepID=A0ABM0MYF5_SACKO|nr:PREDICTED: ceramide kinase-like [Saccoglossus kowalevskii]